MSVERHRSGVWIKHGPRSDRSWISLSFGKWRKIPRKYEKSINSRNVFYALSRLFSHLSVCLWLSVCLFLCLCGFNLLCESLSLCVNVCCCDWICLSKSLLHFFLVWKYFLWEYVLSWSNAPVLPQIMTPWPAWPIRQKNPVHARRACQHWHPFGCER